MFLQRRRRENAYPDKLMELTVQVSTSTIVQDWIRWPQDYDLIEVIIQAPAARGAVVEVDDRYIGFAESSDPYVARALSGKSGSVRLPERITSHEMRVRAYTADSVLDTIKLLVVGYAR